MLRGPRTNLEALNKIRLALEARRPLRVELINYRKDGSEFWVECNIVPFADEEGSFVHWVSVQRDITERKIAEYEREKLIQTDKEFALLSVESGAAEAFNQYLTDDQYRTLLKKGFLNERAVRDLYIRQKFCGMKDLHKPKHIIGMLQEEFPYLSTETVRKIVYSREEIPQAVTL